MEHKISYLAEFLDTVYRTRRQSFKSSYRNTAAVNCGRFMIDDIEFPVCLTQDLIWLVKEICDLCWKTTFSVNSNLWSVSHKRTGWL